jgi:glycosyltransferase involved in cell wall biosynthesis
MARIRPEPASWSVTHSDWGAYRLNKRKRLSITTFFPAYNDEKSIGTMVDTAMAVLGANCSDFEVIVVNDGSADGTAAVLEKLKEKHAPFMRVVTHPENRGYGAALRSGFAAARKEFVFYTDGDGQYDASELPRLIELMDADVGLVNGYKLERRDPSHRIAIGFLYNRFARWLFGVRIRDIDCDYRLIRKVALNDAQLKSSSGTICVELVRMIELSPWRVVETGVHHYPRLHGRSQFFRIGSLINTFSQLLELYWRIVLRPERPARERRVA